MTKRTSVRSNGTKAKPDQLLSVDEARDLYVDQWLLMRIIEFDNDHQPARGYVLRHSRSRKAISARLAEEPPRSQLPADERFFIFHTSLRPVRSGEAVEEGARRFLTGLLSSAGVASVRGRR